MKLTRRGRRDAEAAARRREWLLLTAYEIGKPRDALPTPPPPTVHTSDSQTTASRSAEAMYLAGGGVL